MPAEGRATLKVAPGMTTLVVTGPGVQHASGSGEWELLADWGESGGGGGTGVDDKNFVYVQVAAAASWPITHNLGKYPAVTVLDSTKQELVGQVEHVDLNNCTVTFAGPLSGSASLN